MNKRYFISNGNTFAEFPKTSEGLKQAEAFRTAAGPSYKGLHILSDSKEWSGISGYQTVMREGLVEATPPKAMKKAYDTVLTSIMESAQNDSDYLVTLITDGLSKPLNQWSYDELIQELKDLNHPLADTLCK